MRQPRPDHEQRSSPRRALALVLVAAMLVASSAAAGCTFVSGSEGSTAAPEPSTDAAAQADDDSSDEDAPASGAQTVPSVVGSDVAAARETMGDAGFRTKLHWVFSASGFRTVLSQTRPAGESASAGSWVELMVSLGPAPPAPAPAVLPASAFASPSSPAPGEEVVEAYPTSPSAPPPSSKTVAPGPAPEQSPAPRDPTPVSDVPRGPMEPTIEETETVSYDGDAYAAEVPGVGDVVVFGSDEGMGQALRVVGIVGDSVRIVDGRVERNGTLMDEPYVVYGLDSSYTMEAATTVPDGKVFVVGDNRAALALYDWGLIAVDSIDGKAVLE